MNFFVVKDTNSRSIFPKSTLEVLVIRKNNFFERFDPYRQKFYR